MDRAAAAGPSLRPSSGFGNPPPRTPERPKEEAYTGPVDEFGLYLVPEYPGDPVPLTP